MKQKWFVYGLAAAAAGWIVWACQHDRSPGANPYAMEPTLTVAEAQDFFEQQYAETVPYLTKLSPDRPTGLMPGDFTPLWDKATRAVANRCLEGIDVPIDPRFIFTASFPEIGRGGDTVFRTVDAVQKLVVNRWHDHPKWEGLYAYIATLIPTPEYYARHRNYGRTFVNLGSKGRFSGLVVYHTLGGRFVNADKYRDGVRVAQVYDPAVSPSLSEALDRLAPGLKISGGTPAMYALDKEIDAPEVHVQACQQCGMQECYCQSSGAGCYCTTIGNEGNPEKPTPPNIPPGSDDGGGGDGGGGGNEDENDSNITIFSLFDFTDLTNNQKAEIEQILKQLSTVGLSNSVLQHLLMQGKIKLTIGTVAGHENSLAIYNLQTNTIMLNMEKLETLLDYETNLRNSILEETFHAYQYQIYGNQFDQRAYEFEAKVYGTIIMNMIERSQSILFPYLNPMEGTPYADKGNDFALDVKHMTDDFTHNLSVGDMNILYQTYGEYCTQYPAGDAGWKFKALGNLID